MVATTRPFKTAVLMLAVLLGMALAHGVSAEKFPSSLSMSAQVDQQEENCFDAGGRTFGTTINYDANGNVESTTTRCHGGDKDGRTCTITEHTIDCRNTIQSTRTFSGTVAGIAISR